MQSMLHAHSLAGRYLWAGRRQVCSSWRDMASYTRSSILPTSNLTCTEASGARQDLRAARGSQCTVQSSQRSSRRLSDCGTPFWSWELVLGGGVTAGGDVGAN